MEKAYDLDLAKIDAKFNLNELYNDIIKYGESKSFSSLRPYLVGRNSDDAFSKIPYEKGFNFLFYLENLVNSHSDIALK